MGGWVRGWLELGTMCAAELFSMKLLSRRGASEGGVGECVCRLSLCGCGGCCGGCRMAVQRRREGAVRCSRGRIIWGRVECAQGALGVALGAEGSYRFLAA